MGETEMIKSEKTKNDAPKVDQGPKKRGRPRLTGGQKAERDHLRACESAEKKAKQTEAEEAKRAKAAAAAERVDEANRLKEQENNERLRKEQECTGNYINHLGTMGSSQVREESPLCTRFSFKSPGTVILCHHGRPNRADDLDNNNEPRIGKYPCPDWDACRVRWSRAAEQLAYQEKIKS